MQSRRGQRFALSCFRDNGRFFINKVGALERKVWERLNENTLEVHKDVVVLREQPLKLHGGGDKCAVGFCSSPSAHGLHSSHVEERTDNKYTICVGRRIRQSAR